MQLERKPRFKLHKIPLAPPRAPSPRHVHAQWAIRGAPRGVRDAPEGIKGYLYNFTTSQLYNTRRKTWLANVHPQSLSHSDGDFSPAPNSPGPPSDAPSEARDQHSAEIDAALALGHHDPGGDGVDAFRLAVLALCDA